MRKFFIAMLVLLLLCGCEKGAEVPSEISETAQSVTTTTTAAEVTTTSETTVTTTAETTVTTAETTVTTEETTLMPPLEKEYAWLEADRQYIEQAFLYDFTGDGFPERMELILEPYTLTGCISSEVYGWRDNIVNIVVGDCLYVCRDSNGKNFIITYETNDAMAGMSPFAAVRYDFYADGVHSTVLGETEVYCDGERDYTGICSFLGENLDSGIGKNGGKILNNRLMEYLSEYELIDTITIKYENGRYKASFEADADFTEEYIKDFPEYQTGKVFIGGFEYDKDFPTVWLDDRYFENSFDYDELNKLKNLDYISFNQLSEENIEKAAIKGGDWCGKIEKIYIDASEWGTVRGFSELYNVEHVIISGNGIKRADLEFLKDMPSVRYIYAYFTADSAEAFIPLSEMPNLEAIIDSGHGSCMENLSNEEREKVMELLPENKYFWGMVK